jgi:hypothetical protein
VITSSSSTTSRQSSPSRKRKRTENDNDTTQSLNENEEERSAKRVRHFGTSRTKKRETPRVTTSRVTRSSSKTIPETPQYKQKKKNSTSEAIIIELSDEEEEAPSIGLVKRKSTQTVPESPTNSQENDQSVENNNNNNIGPVSAPIPIFTAVTTSSSSVPATEATSIMEKLQGRVDLLENQLERCVHGTKELIRLVSQVLTVLKSRSDQGPNNNLQQQQISESTLSNGEELPGIASNLMEQLHQLLEPKDAGTAVTSEENQVTTNDELPSQTL